MRRLVSGFLPAILIIALSLVMGPHAQCADPFHEGLIQLTKTPGFENGQWGLLVVDIATHQVLFEHNADRMFAPASVTKLFSTAAALEKLGPDYRFKTAVKRRGEIDNLSILRGDLILVASGDMAMGGRTAANGSMLFEESDHTYGGDNAALVKADPLHAFQELAKTILKSGVKQVAGDVLVDDRLFQLSPSSGSGPRHVSPITINDNLVDVLISAGARPGETATFTLVPETTAMTVDFQVATVEKDQPISIYINTVGPRSVMVRGTIPVGKKDLVRNFEVADPASWARSLFIESLRKSGIKVAASHLAMQEPASLPAKGDVAKLPNQAEYVSPALREYVKIILKVSHNLYASTLPSLLAVADGKTTANEGLRIQGKLLTGLGVKPESISFGGGAGGARADLVTPRATVDLLLSMQKRPGYNAYFEAMPVLGRDGTLAKSVEPTSPARGHAHAKTGTYYLENELSGNTILTSKALAGYMETIHDRKLAYCLFVNNVPIRLSEGAEKPAVNATVAGKLLGKISEWIYLNCPPILKTDPGKPNSSTVGKPSGS